MEGWALVRHHDSCHAGEDQKGVPWIGGHYFVRRGEEGNGTRLQHLTGPGRNDGDGIRDSRSDHASTGNAFRPDGNPRVVGSPDEKVCRDWRSVLVGWLSRCRGARPCGHDDREADGTSNPFGRPHGRIDLSEPGCQGWIWAAFDDRVKGLVASGSIGPFTKIYPDRPPRQRLRFLHEARDEIKELFTEHRDPISYARRISCPVLIATGSNDRACPPAVMPEFVAAFKGLTCVATVPNGLHSPGTRRQAETFRMWVDHTLFDRPLSQLSVEELSYDAGRITCRVRVTGKPSVQKVNLVCAQTNNPKFLTTSLTVARTEDNYTQAHWEVIPMTRSGKTWSLTFNVPNPKPKYTACFVDVRDEFEGRPGHITSLIRQLPTERK
ncbi:MAG: alpha/beta hydrolase family protein [Planctomycetota bacterium]